ncbi:uncharacterized protein LOC124186590 [Neodiprion fabricii]|uniref:uncharacterized protein LOC124186590 n=1 Tax=Neodiprion fabricii TaxID=2872261 RepID=UPI001ED8E052|nr:uncharacterized protein LOC124186590 [Neodiprion fabricii]
MELYSRNSRYRQAPRAPVRREHQSQPRINNNCARCRKRKPGNPKIPQHCPSCLCPPDVVRSSSGGLRGVEDMDEVLARFEELARDPREFGGPVIQQPSGRPTINSVQGVKNCVRLHPKKPMSSLAVRQQRKSEQDQMLNVLYHDLMSSGLANEETTRAACAKYQTPIKSLRQRPNRRVERSRVDQSNHEVTDLDSDAVLRYFRDYNTPKGRSVGVSIQKEDEVGSKEMDLEDEEQRRQLEKDNRELNELSKEVRQFEMEKGGDTQWEKRRPGEDGDQLKRRVSFLPSKLPATTQNCEVIGNQDARSRSPSGDHGADGGNVQRKSTSLITQGNDEESGENLMGPEDYGKIQSRESSLSRDLKDILYPDPTYGRCLATPTTRTSKNNDGQVIEANETRTGLSQSNKTTPGNTKKLVYAGGDLDLHASKSYIVDLIDRALSRELGTAIEERKVESVARPSQSEKEICVEIARALQGDCCSITYAQNCNAPEYVRHLKLLRWDYLNHIQDELRKLQNVERILDSYSPRQSLPLSQSSQASSSTEQKKHHQNII